MAQKTFQHVLLKVGKRPSLPASQNVTRHYSETLSKEIALWLRDYLISEALGANVLTPEAKIPTIYGGKSLDVGVVDQRVADAVAAAKVIADFAKSNDKLVIIGGAYAGKALDANGVKALAAIPSREALISQVAGLLKSPIQRFAAVLAALVEKNAPAAEAVVEAAPAAEAPAAA